MPSLVQYGIGFLLFAHGWVHFVYVASSQGWFGPGEEWGWNGRSWLLSGILEEQAILALARVPFLLVALGFIGGAIGYLLFSDWWVPVLAGSAVLSAIMYIVMWDGRGTDLSAKGALGVLVDVGVLVWLFVPS